MSTDRSTPDAARRMLARFGSQIEYTAREPDGVVNLEKSDVSNDDLKDLIYYPGFETLNLNFTSISDTGLEFIGQMRSLQDLRLYDTLVSATGLKNLLELTRLERLNLGCSPG